MLKRDYTPEEREKIKRLSGPEYNHVRMDLSGPAGKRIILASCARVMKRHAAEIQRLADK